MSAVIELAKYRKPPPAPKLSAPTAPRWFCMACDSEIFRVLADGTVHCGGCHRRITAFRAVKA